MCRPPTYNGNRHIPCAVGQFLNNPYALEDHFGAEILCGLMMEAWDGTWNVPSTLDGTWNVPNTLGRHMECA